MRISSGATLARGPGPLESGMTTTAGNGPGPRGGIMVAGTAPKTGAGVVVVGRDWGPAHAVSVTVSTRTSRAQRRMTERIGTRVRAVLGALSAGGRPRAGSARHRDAAGRDA